MRARTYMVVVLAVVAMGLGACSSSGGDSSKDTGAEDTVANFVNGLEKHDTTVACASYQKNVRKQCVENLPKDATVEGFKVGNSMVDGNKALVVILADKLCLGGDCLTNHDPNKGLPSSTDGFAKAYKAAQKGGSTDPRVPLVKVGDTWYIDAT
jgi:hypothetical protein